MTTSVNEDKDEQKIIEDTSFYSSTEYIEMDARQKRKRYQTHKGYSKTKEKDKIVREIRNKKPNSKNQRTDSLFQMTSRILTNISFFRAG